MLGSFALRCFAHSFTLIEMGRRSAQEIEHSFTRNGTALCTGLRGYLNPPYSYTTSATLHYGWGYSYHKRLSPLQDLYEGNVIICIERAIKGCHYDTIHLFVVPLLLHH
jgi:hypothetical protein